MKLDLNKISELKSQGFIRTNVKDGLMVCCYNEFARFKERFVFDAFMRQLRGIVVEVDTGEVIGHCMSKFFNINECPETRFDSLPKDMPYVVTDKMDGSLLTVFRYKGVTYHTTKGSFNTIFSQYAREYLPNLALMDEGRTLVCEIRIPDEVEEMARVTRRPSGLYLITVFEKDGSEAPREVVKEVAKAYCIDIVEEVPMTLQEVKEQHYSLKDTEGWVVHFANGLRVKFKTAWYMSLNRILDEIDTPEKAKGYVKAILKSYSFNFDWIDTMPQEYREDLLRLANEITCEYGNQLSAIEYYVASCIKEGLTKKEFVLQVKDNPLACVYFHCFDGKEYMELLWKNI